MVSVWELLMPLMFENLYYAKRPMKNLINQSEVDVRLALNSGARTDILGSPLWANSGLMHCKRKSADLSFSRHLPWDRPRGLGTSILRGDILPVLTGMSSPPHRGLG